MSEKIICAYCGEPIHSDEDIAHPFVLSDKPTHTSCAEYAALDEVANVANEKGAEGLEQYDAQADLQDKLNND